MKTKTTIAFAAVVALVLGGCLVSGQITIFQKVDETTTSNLEVNDIEVDLNEEPDYVEHKNDIKSVDEISVVAIIKNNLATSADVKMYISDDPNLTTVAEVEDPANATLVFVGPTVPASGALKIGWADGFRYIVDKKAVADQIFGDGIFSLYAVAGSEFSLRIKAEVAITLTVGK
jgi:hypothetical protein